MMRKEPAATIINKLGGVTAVSRATGASLVTVQRWRWPSERGGTDGFIPRKHHPSLSKLAHEKGFELPAAAFVDAQVAAEHLS